MVLRCTGLEKKLTNSGPFMASTNKHHIYSFAHILRSIRFTNIRFEGKGDLAGMPYMGLLAERA